MKKTGNIQASVEVHKKRCESMENNRTPEFMRLFTLPLNPGEWSADDIQNQGAPKTEGPYTARAGGAIRRLPENHPGDRGRRYTPENRSVDQHTGGAGPHPRDHTQKGVIRRSKKAIKKAPARPEMGTFLGAFFVNA